MFLSGYIKPSTEPGAILWLSGEWSAKSGGVKTDYTERVFITVADPLAP